MKKLFIPLLALLFAYGTVQAQEGFHLGFVSSYNTTWMLDQQMFDSPDFEPTSTYGFAYGPSVGYHFSDEVGIFVQGIFADLGQEYTFDNDFINDLDVQEAEGKRIT
ncbi:MAG: hypothetical protein WBA12_11370, partial [Catalinimonas sp.]